MASYAASQPLASVSPVFVVDGRLLDSYIQPWPRLREIARA